MNYLDMFDVTVACVWTALVTLFITPTIIRVAYVRRLFDLPDTRRLHAFPVPRGGGFAVFTSFVIGFMFFVHSGNEAQKILGATMLMFLLGFKDDLAGAGAKRKLIIQLLAASMLIIMIDVRITNLHGLFGIRELPPFLSYLLSYLFVIAITNAFNLIDGINGLLACVSAQVCMVLGVLLHPHRADLAAMALVLSASLVAFLRYNVRKPQIFMGDSGSLTCGFLVASLAVLYIRQDVSPAGIPLMLSLLFVPTFDIIRTCFVRLAGGRSILSPGKDHTHHVLMAAGFSQFQTLLLLVTSNTSLYLLCLTFSFWDVNILTLTLAGCGLLFHFVLTALTKRQHTVRAKSA